MGPQAPESPAHRNDELSARTDLRIEVRVEPKIDP